ncbi:hypothetical protein CVT24_005063 [Panaeolus cyanescens]|uniref:Uncharacterized protein n=1 Tax=Panaeolus cyanescens TaxID=181874 RepID=A0A409WVL8_9AGAR|nr:hypothetical protein CVT24_005063 [Panaeolus cyanescens]
MEDIINPDTSIKEKEATFHSVTKIALDHTPYRNTVILPYHIFDNQLLKLCHRHDYLCMATSPLDGAQDAKVPAWLIELDLLPTHRSREAQNYASNASLDPMTARVAYISSNRPNEIAIVDFA